MTNHQPRPVNSSANSCFGQLETIIPLCEQLDGYPRHLSLHNGGMLITREPLVDVVPIEYATSGVRVCQFNKDDVEALGLIKFDILGLRTLSIVDESVAMIKETGASICLSTICPSTTRPSTTSSAPPRPSASFRSKARASGTCCSAPSREPLAI